DVPRCQFERQALRQRFNRTLCGCVDYSAGYRVRRRDGTDVDDAAALIAESLDRLLHGQDGSQYVDLVVRVKRLFRAIREWAEAEHTGIVHEHIDAAERRFDGVEQSSNVDRV